jgi:hypothetical protein
MSFDAREKKRENLMAWVNLLGCGGPGRSAAGRARGETGRVIARGRQVKRACARMTGTGGDRRNRVTI